MVFCMVPPSPPRFPACWTLARVSLLFTSFFLLCKLWILYLYVQRSCLNIPIRRDEVVRESRGSDERTNERTHVNIHCKRFKLFASVSVASCCCWRRCLLVFKRRRHILHINNHLSVPQHEFHMNCTHLLSHEMFFFASFHKINIRAKCDKCEWLEVVCRETLLDVACLCDMILMCSLWIVEVEERTSKLLYHVEFSVASLAVRLKMSEACDALKVSYILWFFLLICCFM